MRLPKDSFSLLMGKHEIDGAAKDAKNTHFSQKFQFEVFWHYLPDEVGTGVALQRAVHGTKKTDKPSKRGEHVLEEKKQFALYCRQCEQTNTTSLSYSQFILTSQHFQSHGLSGKHNENVDLNDVNATTMNWRSATTAAARLPSSGSVPKSLTGSLGVSDDGLHASEKNHELRRAGTSLAILQHTNGEVAEYRKISRSHSEAALSNSKANLVSQLQDSHKDDLVHQRHALRQLVEELDQHHEENLLLPLKCPSNVRFDEGAVIQDSRGPRIPLFDSEEEEAIGLSGPHLERDTVVSPPPTQEAQILGLCRLPIEANTEAHTENRGIHTGPVLTDTPREATQVVSPPPVFDAVLAGDEERDTPHTLCSDPVDPAVLGYAAFKNDAAHGGDHT